MNPDGWLAVHHIEHRELVLKAERAARRPAATNAAQAAPVAAPAVVATAAPVCC